MRRPPALLVVPLVLAGCTLGPDYARPPVATPAAWRDGAAETASVADLGWWQVFHDPRLQELVRTALAENVDVRLAAARVLEARALLGLARSAQFPQLDAGARYDNKRASQKTFPPLPATLDPEQEFFKTTLDLAFELDLWGRLRRATEAARAELLAGEAARQAVVTTLVGDVAQAYFDLLELDDELAVARRTLDARRDSLRIVRRRWEEGLTPELDLRRAEGEVASAAAVLPDLERRIQQTENALSVLAGRNPGAIGRGEPMAAQTLPPEVPAGLPSSLLERRPDLRDAEQRLVAANARIGEAKAAFFPRILLTGAVGVESVALSDLFTGPARIWQFGPAITVPVFEAGRNRARLGAAEARREQALLLYQRAVQQAFREVEDALVAHRKAREVRSELEVLVGASRRAVGLAELRYANGLSSYLEVLDARRQLFAAELDVTRARRAQLVAVVQVYKALGGGWTAESTSTE